MKALYNFFLPFLLFLSINCFSQLDSLKGNVKRVYDTLSRTDKFYLFLSLREIDFGQLSLSEDDLFRDFKGDLLPKRFTAFDKERVFNEKGWLMKYTHYHRRNNSAATKSYKYDDHGNIVQEFWDFGNGSYKTTNKCYRLFKDSVYRISSEITYEDDPERFGMKQFFYNDKHFLIEEREIASFSHDYKTTYSYDNHNWLINKEYYRILYKKQTAPDASLPVFDSLDIFDKKSFSYYETGLLKEETSGYIPGSSRGSREKTTYQYDKDNRKSFISYYWGDSLYSWNKYDYNEDGQIKRISYFRTPDTVSRNYIEYFYLKNEISKVYLKEPDKETTFEFRYKTDSQNNWIEQTKLVNGEAVYIRKRIIEYW